MNSQRNKILISDPPIRLGQFLKLANLVQDGLEARLKIQDGQVQVNGTVDRRRGRKLYPGDTVTIGGEIWNVATEKPE